MFANVANLQEKFNKKKIQVHEGGGNNDDVMEVGEKQKGKEVDTSGNIFKRKTLNLPSIKCSRRT